MFKYIFVGFTVFTLLVSPLSVSAARGGNSNENKNEDKKASIMQRLQEKLDEMQLKKEERQEKREEKKSELQQNLSEKKGKLMHIINGEVTAVSGDTFTVESNDVRYNVLTDENTKCRRHFWGKCVLDEVEVGNKVNVWGRVVENTTTLPTNEVTLQATMIRNLSIMKRQGVFIGNITAKDGDTFTLSSKGRGEVEVTVGTTPKVIDRTGKVIAYSDVIVGHRVRVRGLWDKTNKTITEVTEIKDFSIPTKTSTTPAPTSSVSPTVTPTPSVSTSPTPTNTPTPTTTPTPTP